MVEKKKYPDHGKNIINPGKSGVASEKTDHPLDLPVMTLESTVTGISRRFIDTGAIDDDILQSLADVARLSQARYACFYRFSRDEETIDSSFEWCADGTSTRTDARKILSFEDYPWLMSRLQQGETIHIEDTSRMPEEAGAEGKLFMERGCESVLMQPVFSGEKLSGFLSLDNITGTGTRPDTAVTMIVLVSKMIGDSLERMRVQELLRESEEKFSGIFHSGPQIIAITRFYDGTYLEVNDNHCQATGYTRAELIGKRSKDFNIWKESGDRDRMLRIVEKYGKISRQEYQFRMKSGEFRTWSFSAEPIEFNGERCLIGVAIDITEHKKRELLQNGENTILQLLAQGAKLGVLLDAIIRMGEDYDPTIKGSVLLFDSSQGLLIHGAGPSLPEEYIELLKIGLPPGPVAGSCGTAAYRKERVIIPDIKRSELFAPHVDAVATATRNGLLACWSQPILSSTGALLGTIANYGVQTGEPDKEALKVLEWSARIAAIAIERKEAEEKTRMFSQAADGSTDSIAITDKHGIIIYVNAAMEQTYGYEKGELLGQPSRILNAHPESAKEILVTLRDRGTWSGEIEEKKKNGELFPTQMTLSTVWDDRGKPSAFMGAARDITAYKQALQLLKEGEEKFSTIFYANPTPIAIISTVTKEIIDVNKAFTEHSGYDRTECIGRMMDDLNVWVSPEERDLVLTCLETEHRLDGIETRMRLKSGKIATILLSTEVITLAGEEVLITSTKDITEQKQMEEGRRQTEQRAYQSNRLASIGLMAAGIAHEINNPLTGVIGFSELLIDRQNVPDEIKDDLQIINDGAQRVSAVVKGLLAFARQEKEQRTLVDINEILKSTLAFRKYDMHTSNIEVETLLADDLPMTMASGVQLQQVFLNIIVNAESAMKQSDKSGLLTVRTKLVGTYIRISIQDNGTGIPQDIIERIFEPFFTTKQPGEGTGLGLSLCYGIITDHNGRIRAESRGGKGTTFTIELPLTNGKNRTGGSIAPGVSEGEPAAARILVIDDESIVREYLERLLSREGHTVISAPNSDTALDEIKHNAFDVILLDIKMPDMNGTELYERLVELDTALADKVLFVTGDVMALDTLDFFSRTGVPSINKPIDPVKLNEAITALLKNK